jgi:hypothetical protein
MYHGSVKQFTEFEKNKIGSMSRDKSGFYFTNKRVIAKDFYSKETGSAIENLKLMFHLTREYKPSVYDVFLKSVNPYKHILSKDEDYGNREQIIKDAQSNGYDSVLFENVIDGPIMRQDVRIVFEPNQIKSATDNVGTFSKDNNVIYYRKMELTPARFQEIVDSVVNNSTHTIKGRNNEWGKFVDSWKKDGVEVKGYRGSNNRYIVTSVKNVSEQSYYRRIEQYHREKLMYGNLSNEDKQYLSDRGISINEYNRMSQFEREVLFHCK